MKTTILFSALAIAIAGCESPRSPGGAADAATSEDRGITHDDATAHDDAGADSGTAPDAIALSDAANIDAGPGDESIRGTALEGIAIEWPDRLELCNVWRETRPVSAERADQAHVTLTKSDRPSLGSGHLSEAHLSQGLVRRGTLAAEQFTIDPTAVHTALTRYELTKNANDTYLSAELQHDLGAAGVLYEEFGVMRQFGDTRPVKVGGFEYDHSFALMRAGAIEPVVLEPCGGAPELEDALQVITGTDGVRSLTITRQFRTREAFAGSFPVYLGPASVAWSDKPYQLELVSGWFSQTYAAQHHNWQETSLIDFRRDAGFYQTIYAPYLAGSTPVPEATIEVRMFNIDGFSGQSSIEVDTLDLAGHSMRTDTFNVTAHWARVDHAQLLRTAAQSCSTGANVFALGFGDYVFQLLTCPSASPPGFDLVGLVPVAFIHDMAQAGVLVPQSSIQSVTVDQRPGFRATVGTSAVTITKGNPLYFVSVNDSAGMEKTFYAVDPSTIDLQRRKEIVRASDANKTVTARLERLWAGQGVGESSIYAPTAFELSFSGQTVFVEAFDRLRYTNTHHNWADQLEAKGDGLTLTWSIRYIEAPQSCFVRVVRDSDGAELLPETQLTLE